jgi:hypothetical protein
MADYNPTEEPPSSPSTEGATVSELATPLTLSGRTSPFSNDDQQSLEPMVTTQKKKKKKKSKKTTAPKSTTNEAGKDAATKEGRSPVLCISRNKHWKYISSYHVSLDYCNSFDRRTQCATGTLAATPSGIAGHTSDSQSQSCNNDSVRGTTCSPSFIRQREKASRP